MSSLFKRSNWTLQYIDDRRSSPKKQFSLGTKSKRIAKRLQAELDDLYLRGLFDPWTDDFREVLERRKRPGKPQKLITLTEAKERFIASRQGLAPPTVRKYKLVTRLFCECAGPKQVHAVTSQDAASFLRSRELSLTSRHVYLRHLSVFFRWCVKQGWMEENVAEGVRLRRKPEKKLKAFTREEVGELTGKAEGYLRPLIVLASQTGLRRSELSRLRWDDLDLGAKEVHVVGQTKSGKERTLPLPSGCASALSDLEHRTGYVFFTRRPASPVHPSTISHDFLELRRDVLPGKKGYSLHCLRHTALTWMAEAGMPVHVIKRLAGHASIETTMVYLHASQAQARNWIERAFD